MLDVTTDQERQWARQASLHPIPHTPPFLFQKLKLSLLTLKIFKIWFDSFDIQFTFPFSEAKSTLSLKTCLWYEIGIH